MKQFKCQNCSADLAVDLNHSATNRVKCRYCGSIFDLDSDENTKANTKPSIRAISPDYYTINQSANSLSVVRHWRKKGSFILLAMSLIWLIVITQELLETWFDGINNSIFILIILVIAGLSLFYKALSEIFNKTELIVNNTEIILRESPIRLRKEKKIRLNQVANFEIRPPINSSLPISVKSYYIVALTKDKQYIKIIERIKRPEHALFLLNRLNEIR